MTPLRYPGDAALPMALTKLQAQGYEFVTVSELLAAGTPVLAAMLMELGELG